MKYFIFILSTAVMTQTCNKTITLDGSKSYADSGRVITQYKWSGTMPNILYPDSMITKATPVKSGTYHVILTVKDDLGFIGVKDSLVKVP